MGQPSIRVWDPLVRLFHWSLVVSFAVAWLAAEDREDLHYAAGYAAATLITFRLAWGLIGPRYARFAHFVRSPAYAARYIGALFRGCEPRYLGHNPAGALMILALLSTLSVTALTGWMYTQDAFWGAGWVEALHEGAATATLGLVALHVGGVILASLRHHENLVRAMVTGRKRAPAEADLV